MKTVQMFRFLAAATLKPHLCLTIQADCGRTGMVRLLSLGFGTWEIITSLLCLMNGYVGPKFDCYGAGDIMLYCTPFLAGTSLLILVFRVCYFCCTNQIEAATYEAEHYASCRGARRRMLKFATTADGRHFDGSGCISSLLPNGGENGPDERVAPSVRSFFRGPLLR